MMLRVRRSSIRRRRLRCEGLSEDKNGDGEGESLDLFVVFLLPLCLFLPCFYDTNDHVSIHLLELLLVLFLSVKCFQLLSLHLKITLQRYRSRRRKTRITVVHIISSSSSARRRPTHHVWRSQSHPIPPLTSTTTTANPQLRKQPQHNRIQYKHHQMSITRLVPHSIQRALDRQLSLFCSWTEEDTA